jgi:hypothetical protein
MSLDKGIESGKEKRKQYRKSKRFDSTCRNHGSCKYCENNRLHNDKKRKVSADEKLKDLDNNG